MNIQPHHVFTEHKPFLKWLEYVVDYVSAKATDSPLFNIIKEVGDEYVAKFTPKYSNMPGRAFAHPESYLSREFFMMLTFKLGHGKGEDGGIPGAIVERAFNLLVSKGLIYDQPMFIKSGFPNDMEYTTNHEILGYLVKNNLIYNYLFGFPYIIDRYKKSVVKIEVRCGDKTDIGTGWYLDLITEDLSRKKRFVVTNDHVVDKATSLRILTKDEEEITHGLPESLLAKTGQDIAIIPINQEVNEPDFTLNSKVDLLDEIITIGYPKVPLSREAYQVVHKGEINSFVSDYFNNELLVISARTSPGHSGSPVIDDTGRIIGMVTQELFEKEAFQSKGITPYFACLPTSVIISALQESSFFK